MLSLQVPPESELSSVSSKLTITPTGHHLHESKMAFGSKIWKIFAWPDLLEPILLVELETSRLETMVMQNFSYKSRDRQIFFSIFEDFRFAMMKARRVLGGLETASESSLSDDESKTDSKGLIRAPHHWKSIFHLLLKKSLADSRENTQKKLLLFVNLMFN